jgi:hypothetical protein
VPADRVVESLDVVEHVGPGGVPRPVDLSADPSRSVFSDEKKLSMAALSHTFPERLIEQSTLLSAISRWNCSLVYWLPRTPFCLSSGDSRGVDLPATLSDKGEDLSGKVTLQGSNGVEFGMPFCDPTGNVVLGSLVGP